MPSSIKTEVYDKAYAMKRRDKDRDNMFRAMDIMFHNAAKPPAELQSFNWFRWTPTTTPSDAVWGATRVLSALDPRITYAPASYTQPDKDRADRIERVLKTLYKQAGARSKSKHTRQIVWNAVLYDSVAMQLDFLPFQAKNMEIMGGTRARIKSSSRFGPFAVHVRNAKNVHSVHSEWGLERVLFEQILPASEVINFWGDSAKKLADGIKDAKDIDYVYVCDYWDEEVRAVWAHEIRAMGEGWETSMSNPKYWLVPPQKHGLSFIPWVIKGGGSTTETKPELHYRPLLASIYWSRQFDTMNIVRSLIISDEIAKFGEEETVSMTHDGSPAPTSRTNEIRPRGQFNVQVGEGVQRLQQTQLDVGLLQLHDMLQNDMSSSTVSRILLGDVPNDVAYATLNLGQQSAARSIIPYQEIAQDSLAELFTQMLLWSEFAKEDLTAFIQTDEGGREQYTIKHNEIDPGSIQIDVELVADLPTDKTSRMNAAAMGYERLGLSRRWAMEEVGIPDIKRVEMERWQEDLDDTEKNNAMTSMSTEFQQQVVQAVTQQIMQAMQQNQQQQQQINVGPVSGQLGTSEPGEFLGQGGPGFPGVDGAGFDPSAGGQPPAEANPGGTRERQSGSTKTGEEASF